LDNTFLDELVEYPVKALQKIGTNKTVVSLLTNNPSVDMDGDEADTVFDKYLFDYDYVDGTTEEAAAYICVEAELPGIPTRSIKNMKLYVKVVCHKKYMKIDTSKFNGLIGNRRDNITRYVDNLLNGSDVFGIGELSLVDCRTAPAPAGFAARELSYVVSDFIGK
jgi:hypothetical protein